MNKDKLYIILFSLFLTQLVQMITGIAIATFANFLFNCDIRLCLFIFISVYFLMCCAMMDNRYQLAIYYKLKGNIEDYKENKLFIFINSFISVLLIALFIFIIYDTKG